MKAWRRVVPVGVSAVLLLVLGSRLDLAAIAELMRGLSPGWLLAAAALGPVQIVLGGWRWARVSVALGLPLSVGDAVREYGLSTVLNQLLPGGVAGDAVRVWRQRHHGAARATVAAVVDRALGLGVLVVVVVLGMLAWQLLLPPPPVSLWGAVGVGAVVGGGIGLSRVGAPLRRSLGGDGLVQLGISAVLTLTFLLGYAAAAMAVGVTPSVGLVAVVPLVLLAMALPLSFAGWGPRELSASLLWPMLGATPEEGVAISAAYGLSVLLGSLPGLWGLRTPPDEIAGDE